MANFVNVYLGPLVSTFQMDQGPSFTWNRAKKEVVSLISLSFNMVTCIIDPTISKPSLTKGIKLKTGEIKQKTLVVGGANKGQSKNVYKVSEYFSPLHSITNALILICIQFTIANQPNKLFVVK